VLENSVVLVVKPKIEISNDKEKESVEENTQILI
jgi:hypothetical protein